jgi:hypothetical protein
MAFSLERYVNEVVDFSAYAFTNMPDLNVKPYPLLLTNGVLGVDRPEYI